MPAPALPSPVIASVNVGAVRSIEWQGHTVTTGIWKDPVDGPVRVAGVNLAGDDQADRRVHGGPDKAVYAYATEDYGWWAATDGRPYPPGTFGENLTTSGLDLRSAAIGDRWHVGTAVLEVAQPREPCFKLGIRMGEELFPGRFEAAARPGAYLRIVHPGELAAGAAIEVTPAAAPSIAVGQLVRGELPDSLLHQIADDPRVPEGWRRSAARALRG
jgi:MOSC domain-containing protein YiiM